MTTAVNRKEIEMSNLEDYETLYKVDLNFDADVSEMDSQVLTDYIVRVLANHPYYIDVHNIVDVLVNEGSNTVTVVVSTREVQERIVNSTNNAVNLSNINSNSLVNNANNQARLNLISASYNDRKYIMETRNNDGRPVMYEYDFKGFKDSKNLFLEKSVMLNGNKYRHFLRNENDNPYFYDEYMNSEIVYSPEEKISHIQDRLKRIEKNLYEGPVDPNNVNAVRDLVEKSSINKVSGNINAINNQLFIY